MEYAIAANRVCRSDRKRKKESEKGSVLEIEKRGQFLRLITPRSAFFGDTRQEMVQITPRTHRQTLGDPPRRHRRLRSQTLRLRFPIWTELRLAGCEGTGQRKDLPRTRHLARH